MNRAILTQLPALPARFRPLRRLGRGAAGEVWLAEDRRDGARVAVKVFHPAPGSTDEAALRLRFKREFFTLSRLDHPAIVKVHELVEQGGGLCYSMEHVAGRPLRAALRRDPRRSRDPLRTLWSAGEPLLAALAYLHSRGIVHRDLKPDNLLLTPQGDLKLIDFGLILPRAAEFNAAPGELAGTLRYMAPEQIRGLGVDGRADLYSAGAILYELATGRPPFRAASGEALLRKHLQSPPAPPRRYNRAISPAHQAFLLRLLEKSPDARFPSALDALVALRGCPARGRSGHAAAAAVERLAAPLVAPTIGNAPAMASARARIAALARGGGGLVLLGGGMGAGKSRLLEEMQGWAVERAIPVWRGAAREAGGLPAQLFQELFAHLMERRLAGAGPPPPPALALHFPALQPLLQPGARLPPPLSPAAERGRLVAAFREFMRRLAGRRPLLLLFDDVQWADPLSLELLDELLRPPDAGGKAAAPRILAVAALRDDPASRGPELTAWLRARRAAGAARLALAPLTAPESARLARALLGLPANRPLPQARAWHLRTAGNPFFLTATMRALAAIRADTGENRPPAGFAGVDAPRPPETLQAALEHQLLPFPPGALEALRRAALIGREFAFAWWLPVCGRTENELLEIADQALRLGVLEERRGGRLAFTHDLLRAQLLSALPPARKSRLHGMVLAALEQPGAAGPPPALELLTAQALAAGRADRAAHYGHLAARKLFDLYQWDAALDLLLRVERLHAGRRPMTGALRLLHLEIKSRILFSRGEDGLARPLLEAGARLARRQKNPALEQFFRQRLARVYLDAGRAAIALQSARTALRLARGRRDAAGQAMAHRVLALIATGYDRPGAAQRHLDAALRAARRGDDRRVELNVLNDRSGHLYHAGRLRPAIRGFQRVLKFSRRSGRKLEAAIARINLGEMALATGPLLAARRMLSAALVDTLALGVRDARAQALENLARCARLAGDFRRALALLNEARACDPAGHAARDDGERALALHGMGRPAAAQREMRRAVTWTRRSRYAGRHARALINQLELSLLRGDEGAARRTLRRVLAPVRGAEPRSLAGLVFSHGARLDPLNRALRAQSARAVRAYAAAGHRLHELTCRRNLAAALLFRGRNVAAEKLLRRAPQRAKTLGFAVLAGELAALQRAARGRAG